MAQHLVVEKQIMTTSLTISCPTPHHIYRSQGYAPLGVGWANLLTLNLFTDTIQPLGHRPYINLKYTLGLWP